MKQLALLSFDSNEEADVPEELQDEQDTDFEAAISESQNEIQEIAQDRANQISSLESLDVLLTALEEHRDAGDSAKIQAVLKLSHSLYPMIQSRVAIENIDLNETTDEGIAIEGLRDIFNRILQNSVLGWKNDIDMFHDIFNNTKKRIRKYRTRLEAVPAEYRSIEFTGGQKSLSLNGLWYFFRTDKGQITDIVKALNNDLKVNEYIFKKYPKDVIGSLNKVTSALSGVKLKDSKDIKKFVSRLESLGHPVDLFKGFPLQGYPYLDYMGLRTITQRQRPVSVSVDGVTSDRIRDLTTFKSINEDWSLKHKAMSVGTRVHPIARVASLVLSKQIDYQITDIPTCIKAGLSYLDNAEDYLNFLEKTIRDIEKAIQACQKLIDNTTYDGREVRKVMTAVVTMIDIHMDCLRNPAMKELTRSAKAARFIDYAARRMIANAS